MIRISCVMIVRNEIERLKDAVSDVKQYVDEVVICDQASDDGTAELAQLIANVFVADKRHGFCEASRPLACEAARGEWILVLDADELLAPSIGRQLHVLAADERFDGYGLLRDTIIGGIRRKDYHHYRFFRKGTAELPTTLHSNASWRDETRKFDIPGISILHHKSAAEQNADNERYWNECGQEQPPGCIEEEDCIVDILKKISMSDRECVRGTKGCIITHVQKAIS